MGRGALLFWLTNLFTIQRWNNRPALVRFSEADNAFNTFFLNVVFKTLHGKSVEPALRWRLSRELPKVVLSDVSLQLKERIERFSPTVWSTVSEKAVSELESLADREFVGLLIDKEASNDELDKLADLYVSYLEALENAKLFDYTQPLTELREKVLRIVDSFENRFWNLARYVWPPLLNLTSMVRWNRTHRNVRTTVSGHSFIVVTVAYALAKLASFPDVEEVILRATFHDFPEAFTGDVITPTKKKVPELEELVSRVEREMVLDWLSGNDDLRHLVPLIEFFVEPFSGQAGTFVRVADYVATLLECGVELNSGNRLEIFRSNFFAFKKLIKESSPVDLSDWIDEIETIVFR